MTNIVGKIFGEDETADAILSVFDSPEVTQMEQTSTELFFIKADAALAIQKLKYGEKAKALKALSEKVKLDTNSLSMYALTAKRVPHQYRDVRLTPSLYRQASNTGKDIAAQKLVQWCVDTYNDDSFSYEQFNLKQEHLREIVRNDGSDDEMDTIIETELKDVDKATPLHHDFAYLPFIITSPGEIEESFTDIIQKVYEEWYKLSKEGKVLNLRGKVSLDFWAD